VVLLSHYLVQAQTPIQRRSIIKDYHHNKLQAMAEEFTATAHANKQEALKLAKIHGWEPIKYNASGTFDELMGVRDDGSPIYYTLYNVAAAKSTRTDHLNTGGSLGLDLNGQDMKVYVWDGGPTLPTHQEFNDQINPSRVIINDGVTILNRDSWHAQHVTGTILAAGVQPNAKGMAPLAQAFTHDWNNDLAEATTAAGAGMLLSNHSYGLDVNYLASHYFGAYEHTARAWDELMYNAPAYLPVFAAGNEGNYFGNDDPLNGNTAFDKLSGWQTAKNNLVVANAQDANVTSNGSLINVAIDPGSSQGPTDDFRIKPDITGNGTGLFSTNVNSNTGYRLATGTSMAAPNVTGSLLLLQQHYNNLNGSFMQAATLKGLALHTADDAGMAGPDAIFGWGLLNAKAAAQEITNNGITSIISELTLTPGQSYSLLVEADGINDLIASISWTDPPGTVMPLNTPNNSTPTLVNDLDIRVTQAISTFLPYRLTGVDTNDQGDNIVDPYERVDVKGARGSYIVTVTHKGSLSGGSQNYSLIVTGTMEDDNEAPTVALAPITLTLDENGEVPLFATQLDNGSTDNITLDKNLMFSFDADGNETDIIFDCDDLGDHQVTLYVTDERENSASASTIVTVEEHLDNLVAIAKDITVQLDTNGQISITPEDVDNGSSYGCNSTPSLNLDRDTFDCEDVGTLVTVTLTASHGDNSDMTTAVVTVETTKNCELEHFNRGFSPNGDGIADTFVIENLEKYRNNVVKIYDLNQRLLFSAHYGGLGDAWDGIHRGRLVPVGSYVCVIHYNEPGLSHEVKMIYVNY